MSETLEQIALRVAEEMPEDKKLYGFVKPMEFARRLVVPTHERDSMKRVLYRWQYQFYKV